MKTAWDQEPDLVDEINFTSHAETGWSAWNCYSPEKRFCEAAAEIVQILETPKVLETGVGQGFTTRRVAKIAKEFTAFEAEVKFRNIIAPHATNFTLSNLGTPSPAIVAATDFLILDSAPHLRLKEIKLWWQAGKGDSFVLIHDAGNGHDRTTSHHLYDDLIRQLNIPGIKYANPRGSFLGWKTRPTEEILSKLKTVMPVQA
jgi:hypothetical protein